MNAYQREERQFWNGDRLKCTARYNNGRWANRQLRRIEHIDSGGNGNEDGYDERLGRAAHREGLARGETGGAFTRRMCLRLVLGVLSGNPGFDQVLVLHCLLEQILGLGVRCDLGIVVVDHVSLAPAGFKVISERPSG